MIKAEFTVYPFVEGLGFPDYVQAAIDTITEAGLEAELGPLSQTVRGEPGVVLGAVRSAAEAAIRAGATRVVLNIEVEP
jgi:uncharacterized protein YqgV (UPF0045/DUF77 family)